MFSRSSQQWRPKRPGSKILEGGGGGAIAPCSAALSPNSGHTHSSKVTLTLHVCPLNYVCYGDDCIGQYGSHMGTGG